MTWFFSRDWWDEVLRWPCHKSPEADFSVPKAYDYDRSVNYYEAMRSVEWGASDGKWVCQMNFEMLKILKVLECFQLLWVSHRQLIESTIGWIRFVYVGWSGLRHWWVWPAGWSESRLQAALPGLSPGQDQRHVLSAAAGVKQSNSSHMAIWMIMNHIQSYSQIHGPNRRLLAKRNKTTTKSATKIKSEDYETIFISVKNAHLVLGRPVKHCRAEKLDTASKHTSH